MDLEQFKQGQRQAWAAGDYRPVGRMLGPAADALVERAGVASGDRVLDVATGSGSVAVVAARAGADVVGVDHTNAWFDEARRRADEAGVAIDLRVGDAEDLPVPDGKFDVVLSSFGAIFAPRHEVVASELVRACRPGGTIGLTAWTPESASNAILSTLVDNLPSPPSFVTPPITWGEPDHVMDLFAPHGVQVTIERNELPVVFASLEDFETFCFEHSGPMMAARRTLEELGRWDRVHDTWRADVADSNEADDGSFRSTWEYLLVIGTTAA